MKNIYLIILISLFSVSLLQAQVVFVASDATGNNNGTSWANAYTDLQIALDDAQNGSKQVWVKSGTYHPTSGSDRSITFNITNNVELYGGFNGTETSLSERDFRMNETIISGNIGDPNQNTDNSRNLFITSGDHPKLDGITLSDIYDNSSSNSGAVRLGAGNGFQSFSMANCTIKNNTTPNRTSGVFAFNGTINIEHCLFFNNIGGDVIYLASNNANLNVTNNLIVNNNAVGINLNGGQAVAISNNTIYGNQTGIRAFFVPFNLHNNILWNNAVELDILGSVTITNNIIEGTTEPNNFDIAPGFKDPINGDFKLTTCSAARNLGDNSFIPINLTNDILGNDRVFDITVDMGAYEVPGFPIQINAVETLDIECFGSSSGQIALGVTGGIGGLEYSIDGVNFQSNSLFTDLPSGSYTIEVRDQDGCMDMTSATLNELSASALTFVSNVTDNGCFGNANGEISITPSGGVAPFNYSIDGASFQSSNSFSGLVSDTYNVIVLDAVGCTINSQVVVSEPSVISPSSTISNISCRGAADGEISVTVTGGTPGYTYNIDNGTFGVSSSFTSLPAGTYTIGVLDANACLITEEVTITEPDALSFTITETDISCNGLIDGVVSITATGGTAPYEYSIDGTTYQSANSFTGLAANTYSVNIRDANNCEVVGSALIEEPVVLSASASATINCFGDSNGSIDITASGGTPPFSYSLDGTNFQGSKTFDNLTSGSYTVTILDDRGCSTTAQQTVDENSQINLSSSVTMVSCNGDNDGMITISASGGTGTLEYSLDGINYQSSSNFNALSAGTYNVGVRDGVGCTVFEQVIVTEPAELVLTASFDGNQVSLSATGGTTPYQYAVNDGSLQTSEVFILENGSYTFSVIDANGCEVSTSNDIAVTSLELNPNIMYNVYPNPATSFVMIDSEESMKSVRLLNFNGKLIKTIYPIGVHANLDISNLTKGIYLIEVMNEEGTVKYQKLMKE